MAQNTWISDAFAVIRRLALGAALALLPGLALADGPVSFKATDGVEITGDFYGQASGTRPLVLLFHMASSNRGEYKAIAPKLNALGFDALAIDQRSGGTGFGSRNETVARLGRSTGFDEALKDLDAALTFARSEKPARPVIIWGSSYSASLVFLLAAARPKDVSAVLSFSPGEYLGRSVKDAAKQVNVPIFVTSASDSGEIGAARVILTAAGTPATRKTQFVPKAGVHGSSTLDPARNPSGAQENWSAVTAFLTGLK